MVLEGGFESDLALGVLLRGRIPTMIEDILLQAGRADSLCAFYGLISELQAALRHGSALLTRYLLEGFCIIFTNHYRVDEKVEQKHGA